MLPTRYEGSDPHRPLIVYRWVLPVLPGVPSLMEVLYRGRWTSFPAGEVAALPSSRVTMIHTFGGLSSVFVSHMHDVGRVGHVGHHWDIGGWAKPL